MNIAKLRSIQKHIEQALPGFAWTVLTRKEVAELGIADPPCAMLRGQMGETFVTLDVDGEIWMAGEFLPDVDTALAPKELACQLTQRLHEISQA